MSLNDDATLIAATLDGDTAAFGRLVGLYQDRLYNSLLRVAGSAEDAADIDAVMREIKAALADEERRQALRD